MDESLCKSGSEALVRTLVCNGCTVCFTNPGTSEMHFCQAVDDTDGMRSILVLFEGVASGACLGYGVMADRPACCLMHLAGGLGNAVANLHNCRRSFAPTLVICGDHATDHQYDQHLQAPIVPIAQSYSSVVKHTLDSMALVRDTTDCLRACVQAPGNVATLVLPANVSWNSHPPLPIKINAMPLPLLPSDDFVALGVRILLEARERGAGKNVLLLHGLKTLREDGLIAAARVAEAAGCRRLVPTFNGRKTKGPGLPSSTAIPYFAEQQVQILKDVEVLLLVNAKHPAGFFGYPEGGHPSWVLPKGCRIIELASYHDDGVALLQRIADALGAPAHGYAVVEPKRPSSEAMQKDAGRLLAADVIGRAMALHVPDNFILANEGNTLGGAVLAAGKLEAAARHDELQLVGGAIGQGLPVAVGAAVACPDRKVVCLQADGSAMYTIQALWTMGREGLDVTTVILDNGAYAVLQLEYGRMTGAEPKEKARSMFDLGGRGGSGLDFVAMARGMGVDGCRCEKGAEFVLAFERAMNIKGPYLIQCVVRPQSKV